MSLLTTSMRSVAVSSSLSSTSRGASRVARSPQPQLHLRSEARDAYARRFTDSQSAQRRSEELPAAATFSSRSEYPDMC